MNILFGTALLCKIPAAGGVSPPLPGSGIRLGEGSKLEKQAENGGARGGVRAVSERYCPVAGRNVAVEITRRGFAETDAKCLSDCACKGSPGGCRNRFLPVSR